MSNRPSARNNHRISRVRQPLDSSALERLALDYAGRYATSRAKLAAYLHRKIQERGWAGEDAPPIDPLVERFAQLGYVDDRMMAESRARSLAARGYGPRRVDSALRGLGIGDADAADARAQARDGAWAAALAFARRRRFGPFAAEPADEAVRRRAFGAMVRAGHDVETVQKILDLDQKDDPFWDSDKTG
jgi:regulatory protein